MHESYDRNKLIDVISQIWSFVKIQMTRWEKNSQEETKKIIEAIRLKHSTILSPCPFPISNNISICFSLLLSFSPFVSLSFVCLSTYLFSISLYLMDAHILNFSLILRDYLSLSLPLSLSHRHTIVFSLSPSIS